MRLADGGHKLPSATPMRKTFSYLVAGVIGLLAVAPPINYDLPLTINSFFWVYAVVVSGLFGFFLIFQEIHNALKALAIYLFLNCFISQAPYLSFNAYILVISAIYFYILCRKCDFNILINVIAAVFWLEVVLCLLQRFGLDTLLNFGDSFAFDDHGNLINVHQNMVQHTAYFGTVFQQMRMGSLFCIMSPFLFLKSKWYLVPVLIMCFLLGILGFVFAIAAGVFVYGLCIFPKQSLAVKKMWINIVAPVALGCCVLIAVRNWQHIYAEIIEGRLPIGWVVIKSWMLDTTGPFGARDLFGISQTGPFDVTRFLFGHGMDTFMPLFPVYKHDPGTFAQAHNDWLQMPWEIGFIGLVFFFWYYGFVIKALFQRGFFLLLAGVVVISVNRFFAFPDRMTQTILIMVAFAALCDYAVYKKGVF